MKRDFSAYLAMRRPALEEAIRETLSDLLSDALSGDAPIALSTLSGGKKLRGCLTCLVSDACGGNGESALPRAVAVELIQAATLIHDDFVDQHRVRRERPALWTLTGARRAVLIGDVIFASAIHMMSRLSSEDGRIAARSIAEIARGALHEPLDPQALAGIMETGGLKGEDYERIIYLKTGVLFGTACRLGAMAAGAGRKEAEASYQYGLRIGEAYQIADDLLEVKEHLSRRTITPHQMTALAPAYLCFSDSAAPYIQEALKGEGMDPGEPAWTSFSQAATRMEREIERRLESARARTEGCFPHNGYLPLMQEAPRTIIGMFINS